MLNHFKEEPNHIKQIVIDLMTAISQEILMEAQESPDRFLESIKRTVSKYGSSWADIVIDFKWHHELELIYKSPYVGENLRNTV